MFNKKLKRRINILEQEYALLVDQMSLCIKALSSLNDTIKSHTAEILKIKAENKIEAQTDDSTEK